MSLIGEGSIGQLTPTYTVAAPAVLADFNPNSTSSGLGKANGVSSGPDGRPCNVFVVHNGDSTGSVLVWAKTYGLHDAVAGNAAIVWPGQSESVQATGKADDIGRVVGWATDMSGNAYNGTVTISGHVLSRRNM